MKDKGDKQFLEYVEKKVRDTIRKNKLFTKKDKVVIAVSGGKDSTVCLYILKKLGYDIEAVTIDASIGNYTKTNVENIKKVCKDNEVKLHILSFRESFGMSLCYMRSVLKSKGQEYSSCMLCGILKRYLLNKFARENNFDALATGHNLDDEAQAFVMNVFRNDFKLATRQGPVSGTSQSKKFTKRVKPLYMIQEEETKRFSKLKKFPVNYGICPCSVAAYRREYREMLDEFEKRHPPIKYNIIHFQKQLKENMPKSNKKMTYCESCDEPASNRLCKVCTVLSELKDEKGKTTKKEK